ncbi:hypothetical protein [Paenibacillus ginsengarvi]|uniref:Uncharacterized protein n=1 Tax=Paenibacillus ginsengarvi TaxID=400777 RepID=A0A3B0BK13_9BACL|nr:hypothetical protein [Paenibacillus ginsengarvi]RKN74163.1 hypothetical protein D7M11_27320 [Paenibacillus ginsengarvi]
MDELLELKTDLRRLTVELIGKCKYCSLISSDVHYKTPIYCTKFTGDIHPTCVDIHTCLACQEYKGT